MAEIAALIGDPARANMLAAMLDGRAHAAGELAASAGIAAPTASGHLGKLLEGGLIEVAAQGRHRYYRLASVDVARTLEGIMTLSAEPAPRGRATPRIPPALREARTCYDHLAGRLGVAIADALIADETIVFDDGAAAVTEKGRVRLAQLGLDLGRPCGRSRRPLCRLCLDWSERRPHLAGMIGLALLEQLMALHWIRRKPESRAISITPLGRQELERTFGFTTG